MSELDAQRERGKSVQGQLWPQVLTGPTGQFPAAQLAPDFYDLVQRTAFGELWSRPGLAVRDRSLITVAMLATLGHLDELRAHLTGATNLGISRDELVEVLMQVSIYAGVPAAGAALRVAAEVLGTD